MSRVFLAYDPLFEREVAIKILPHEWLYDAQYRQRFIREARLIAALEHPAIVPVYDFGEQDGHLFLVMRYMAGDTLHERIQRGTLSIPETATIMRRIASALDLAHQNGVIHRDLKPGNILFDALGEAYLSDFGIARLVDSNTTLSGRSVLGTPAYMSPEQARGDALIDSRTDIYALGAILFEMLTGRVPYEAETPTGQLIRHIQDPIPEIHSVRGDLPGDCQAVIERALAKQPAGRYRTAGELAAHVQELSGRLETARRGQVSVPASSSPAEQTLYAGQPLAGEALAASMRETLAASGQNATLAPLQEATRALEPPSPLKAPTPKEPPLEAPPLDAPPKNTPSPKAPSQEQVPAEPPVLSPPPSATPPSATPPSATPSPESQAPGAPLSSATPLAAPQPVPGSQPAPGQDWRRSLLFRLAAVPLLALLLLGLCVGANMLISILPAASRPAMGPETTQSVSPSPQASAAGSPTLAEVYLGSALVREAGDDILYDRRAGGEDELLLPGAEILAGEDMQIWTLGGAARLELSDGAVIRMAPETSVWLVGVAGPGSQSGRTQLRLDKGALLVKAGDARILAALEPYQVWGRYAIMGVTYDPNRGRFVVDCLEGTCLLGDEQDPRRYALAAGQRLGFDRGALIEPGAAQRQEWVDLDPEIFPTLTPTPPLTATATVRPTSTSTYTATPQQPLPSEMPAPTRRRPRPTETPSAPQPTASPPPAQPTVTAYP